MRSCFSLIILLAHSDVVASLFSSLTKPTDIITSRQAAHQNKLVRLT